jgi:hypothetical protein
MKAFTEIDEIIPLGISIGASFAALASKSSNTSNLILWNPTTNGKRFVREQKLMSELLSKELGTLEQDDIDAAGVYLTPPMQEDFRDINLTKLDYRHVKNMLLITRKEMKQDEKLISVLKDTEVNLEHRAMPGYQDMMASPTDTVVPVETLRLICEWVSHSSLSPVATINKISSKREMLLDQLELLPSDHNSEALIETPAFFGESEHLFGIASRRVNEDASKAKTAFVFLNCGSEHHAGPHRIYSILARKMASRGSTTFRFDIEGIGDSVSNGRNPDNNSYSPIALDDINSAMSYIESKYGCENFIVSGICAGAYHSFKSAANIENHNITKAILINPLVYQWNYENPEKRHIHKMYTYKNAFRDFSRWQKLLTGQADYKRLVSALSQHTQKKLSGIIDRIIRLFRPAILTGVPGDLCKIEAKGRSLTLIIAESDPGFDILKLEAPRETRTGLDSGNITVHQIPKANHGFSKKSMRDRLITTFTSLNE